jgi:hypothetical protein
VARWLPVVIRKTKTAAAGAANWLAEVTPGLRLGARLESILGHVHAGVDVREAPAQLLAGQRIGLLLTGHAEAAARADQRPAPRITNRSAALWKPPQTPALAVTQIRDTLEHRRGGNAVAETAVAGRTDWTGDANAVSGTSGRRDGVLASIAGNALEARGGRLDLSYPDHPDRTGFTISSVRLHFYVKQASTVLNNGDLRLAYGLDTDPPDSTLLETITGDVDALTVPRTFDITAAVQASGSSAVQWAVLQGLRTSVRFESAAAEVQTADVDAVEVEIDAALVITL